MCLRIILPEVPFAQWLDCAPRSHHFPPILFRHFSRLKRRIAYFSRPLPCLPPPTLPSPPISHFLFPPTTLPPFVRPPLLPACACWARCAGVTGDSTTRQASNGKAQIATCVIVGGEIGQHTPLLLPGKGQLHASHAINVCFCGVSLGQGKEKIVVMLLFCFTFQLGKGYTLFGEYFALDDRIPTACRVLLTSS